MRHALKTALPLLCIVFLYACSDSDNSDSVITDAEDSANGDSGNADQGTGGQGNDGRPNANRSTSVTRSPQGINENANERREIARNRDGRNTLSRLLVGNREIRTYDGTNNNESEITWGASFEHLQRIGPSNYSDGISAMAGTDLAGAREISNIVAVQGETESILNPFGTSDFLWQWGQFIDHDLSLTDGSTDESINIPVPSGDVYFDPDSTGTVEIEANRAIYDPDSGLTADNPREQENEITSWIDGSMVYGSDDERALALRVSGDSPFLATSENNLLPFNISSLSNANGFVTDATSLFLAGDVRVNEQIGLAAMHTLWVREHNRIASNLLAQSPDASAEEIFQSARRLVIAKIQIITYNEYLPALLGPNTMPAYTGYDAAVNPNMYNEFTVAAYRLGHSELSSTFLRLDANGDTIVDGDVTLFDAFFTAHEIFQEENDIDPVLRGLASQLHQAIDIKVISDLRNFLFGQPGAGGLDLVALNIQRGRDHGIGSYNDTREAMGLGRVTSFAEISGDADVQTKLSAAYESVDDIDLWVGGLAETPLSDQGSQLGELFTAIVVRQFDEVRAADRFWYERDLNDAEQSLISDTTLASVIRDNTSIGDELQDNVFFVSE